jgi:hypothetical protein
MFDATPSTGANFSLSFTLPTGQKQGLLETDSSRQEIRFPFLAFLIDPIKLNPPPGGSR